MLKLISQNSPTKTKKDVQSFYKIYKYSLTTVEISVTQGLNQWSLKKRWLQSINVFDSLPAARFPKVTSQAAF